MSRTAKRGCRRSSTLISCSSPLSTVCRCFSADVTLSRRWILSGVQSVHVVAASNLSAQGPRGPISLHGWSRFFALVDVGLLLHSLQNDVWYFDPQCLSFMIPSLYHRQRCTSLIWYTFVLCRAVKEKRAIGRNSNEQLCFFPFIRISNQSVKHFANLLARVYSSSAREFGVGLQGSVLGHSPTARGGGPQESCEDFLRRSEELLESSRRVLAEVEEVRSHSGSSHFGSSWGPSPRLEFPLHLPSRQLHQDSFRVRFLFAVLIAWPLLLVALSSSVGNLVVLESCPLPVVANGYTAGRKPATCRTCGKTFPRPNVTLSDPSPAGGKGIKGNRSRNSSPAMSRRSRNVSPVVSRKASVVSWSDPPREQSEANGDDAVMEDGTETHQAEIIKKIRANDKLRKMLTNMPWEHRTFIYDDSFKSNMESLDDEKAALLAAKRQFLPLQSRIDKQKNYLERVSKEIESKQQKRLEILHKMDRG